MTPDMPRQRTVTTAIVISLSVLVVLMAGAVSYLIVSDFQGRDRDRQNSHAQAQANVSARYDDCQGGEDVRAALRAQVDEGKRTDPLFYKLLPSLNTPEVRELVRTRRERQLKAYAARDCRTYALAAVPERERASFHVP